MKKKKEKHHKHLNKLIDLEDRIAKDKSSDSKLGTFVGNEQDRHKALNFASHI